MSTSISSEGFLTDYLGYLQTQCLVGMSNLVNEAYLLVFLLGIIVLVLRLVTDGHIFGGGSWTTYILMILKIGAFIFLVKNWQKITIDILLKSFEVAGMTAGNISVANIDASGIFTMGFKMTQNLLTSVTKTCGWQIVMGILPLLLLQMTAVVLIILAFGFMALQYFLISVEFYVFASAAVILIPFGMVPKLKFLFDNVVSGLFSLGVKYMTIIFIIGLGQSIFSESALAANSGPEVILRALVGVLVYAAMITMIPSLVAGMIHGSPDGDSRAAGIVGGAVSSVAVASGRRIVGSLSRGAAGTSTRARQGFNMTRSGAGGSSTRATTVDPASQKALANIKNTLGGQ